MKVWYLITSVGQGGAQQNVLSLVRDQLKRGHEVRVFAGMEGKWLADKLPVTLERLPLKRSWNPIVIIRYLLSFYRSLSREKPDIIHLHSTHPLLVLLFKRFFPSVRWVFTVHGLSIYEQQGFRPFIYRFFLRVFIPFLDFVIFVCEYDREKLLLDISICNKKTSVIFIGIQPIGFYSKKVARRILGIKENAVVVGTIGRFVNQKAQCVLLDAFAELLKTKSEIQLCLIGYGPLQHELQLRAEQLGIDNRVSFCRGDARLVKGFDVFVNTSSYEGLPYVLLEAGLAGVPIVSTNVGGVSELIPSGKGLLVSQDSGEISSAIDLILKNDQYKNALRQIVRTRFSESEMCERIDGVYRQLLNYSQDNFS